MFTSGYKSKSPTQVPADQTGEWASEALANFTKGITAVFGLRSDDLLVLNVAAGSYHPGACAGTIGAHGRIWNVGVYGDPDTAEREARLLTPVLV
jgi:hypothetical protein